MERFLRCRHKLRSTVLFLFGITLWASPSVASMPVPFAMVGCIKESRFLTEANLRSPRFDAPALRALEAKTIRIEGLLYPHGFQAVAVYLIADSCKPSLFASYFLCDPCQTQFSHPPSKLVPPREAGIKLDMPDDSLKELENLNARFEQ